MEIKRKKSDVNKWLWKSGEVNADLRGLLEEMETETAGMLMDLLIMLTMKPVLGLSSVKFKSCGWDRFQQQHEPFSPSPVLCSASKMEKLTAGSDDCEVKNYKTH